VRAPVPARLEQILRSVAPAASDKGDPGEGRPSPATPYPSVTGNGASHAPRPDPYVRLSRIRLCDGKSFRIRSGAFATRNYDIRNT
jgi:hypothetical protein